MLIWQRITTVKNFQQCHKLNQYILRKSIFKKYVFIENVSCFYWQGSTQVSFTYHKLWWLWCNLRKHFQYYYFVINDNKDVGSCFSLQLSFIVQTSLQIYCQVDETEIRLTFLPPPHHIRQFMILLPLSPFNPKRRRIFITIWVACPAVLTI